MLREDPKSHIVGATLPAAGAPCAFRMLSRRIAPMHRPQHGLADGVRQIGEASGFGAMIEADALPIEPGASVHEALTGGEDYELLFAVSPKTRQRLDGVRRLVKDLAITRIGRLTSDRALLLERNGRTEELPRGFTHFASQP